MRMSWIQDSAHEWLVVPLKDAKECIDKLTSYSYKDEAKGLAYLEGDFDAATFLDYVAARDRKTYWVKDMDTEYHDGYCFVRNLHPLK